MLVERPFTQADWESTPEPVKRYIEHLEDQVQGLTKALELLTKRVEELEARLAQDSGNSDRPPSSDPPYKKSKRKLSGAKGKAGARKGHKGHRQEMLEPTREEIVFPERCACGNRQFDPKAFSGYYTHQHLELPLIRMEVTHYLLMKGPCPACGKTVKGRAPRSNAVGYGPRLSALLAELAGIYGVSRQSVRTFCRSVLGFPISLGGLQRVIDRVSAAIHPLYDEIGRGVRASPVNHVDETSWFTKGQLKWIWTLTNKDASYFMVHDHRSKQAFGALVRDWQGKLVSDNYNAYTGWPGPRQSCLAHLIRRAKGLRQRKKKETKAFGRQTLSRLRLLCSWAKSPPDFDRELAFWADWWKELTAYPGKSDEAGRFARLLMRQFKTLGLFLDDPDVEPTNNAAERALRYPVIWRKCSKGTQSEKGERWVERVLTFKQTWRIRHQATFPALTAAMDDFLGGNDRTALAPGWS
jgi:transposase